MKAKSNNTKITKNGRQYFPERVEPGAGCLECDLVFNGCIVENRKGCTTINNNPIIWKLK